MKKTLTILLVLSSVITNACTCYIANIQQSYSYSTVIFYGKYVSTDTVVDFHDSFGQPFIVDNFEVRKCYRGGIDSLRLNKQLDKKSAYIISLINSCEDPCGICFKKDRLYLVYAYRNAFSGHLTTDGCTRTREILNNNFITPIDFDPDSGKDEDKELNKLMLSDMAEKYLSEYENALNFQKELLKSQLAEANAKLDSRTKLLYWVVSGTIIMTLFYYKV